METFVFVTLLDKFPLVLTVPMRNGNQKASLFSGLKKTGSYRTYEEWKPEQLVAVQKQIKVLTVPMRNGNLGGPLGALLGGALGFLPYL